MFIGPHMNGVINKSQQIDSTHKPFLPLMPLVDIAN